MNINDASKQLPAQYKGRDLANEMLKRFDSDGDKAIDLKKEQASQAFTADKSDFSNFRKLKAAAAKIDSNADGKLSQDELKAFFAKQFTVSSDVNQDGKIDVKEALLMRKGTPLKTAEVEAFLDKLSEKQELAGDDLRQFIDREVDKMGEGAAKELLRFFDVFGAHLKKVPLGDQYGPKDGKINTKVETKAGHVELNQEFLKTADVDQDGLIDKAEIKGYFAKKMDTDGDGQVSAEEFKTNKDLDKDFWKRVSH